MRSSDLIIVLLAVDLFLFFGVTAIAADISDGGMGGTNLCQDVTGNRLLSYFLDTNAQLDQVSVNVTFNQSIINYTDVSATEGQVFVSTPSGVGLSPVAFIIGFAQLLFDVVTIPFTISSCMGLSAALAWIPATLYSVALLFGGARFLSGRDI